MTYEGDRADSNINARVRGDSLGKPQRGILSGRTMPPTILVTQLDTGALVIQGRPDGPHAYLHPDDAVPLKRELAAAFEYTEQVAPSNDGETW